MTNIGLGVSTDPQWNMREWNTPLGELRTRIATRLLTINHAPLTALWATIQASARYQATATITGGNDGLVANMAREFLIHIETYPATSAATITSDLQAIVTATRFE